IVVPVTKLAESDARNIAAPDSSSGLPKRFIGVRSKNSAPRGVPSRSFSFNAVRKTPGTIAFTHTPYGAHSIASDFVSDATPALLAEYAAISNRETNDVREPMLMIRPYRRSIM